MPPYQTNPVIEKPLPAVCFHDGEGLKDRQKAALHVAAKLLKD